MRRNQVWRLFFFCPILILSTTVNAEPFVIYDSGRTRPITDYLVQPDRQVLSTLHSRPTIPNRPEKEIRPFPVQTTEMTPGEVRARRVDLPQLAQPVFLIGTDPRSHDWLLEYRDRLRELRAVGMVVDVDTEEEFQAVRSLAPGLELTPVSGSTLAKQFNLNHYPVLIGPQRIEQ